MKNFKLIIEYDGTNYFGWQRQKEQVSIQETIEDALAKILCQPVTLIGSGRTDTGVHAFNQVANFQADTKLTPVVFKKGLNSLLPRDISIKSCEEINLDFHARFSAKSKSYRYNILNSPFKPALFHQYAWHINMPLNTDAMKEAVLYLVGTHDFKAFEGAGSPKANTVRTVLKSDLNKYNENIVFEIEATGFLRYMVRNIVGTLVFVGLNKLLPQSIENILISGRRSQAGPTAPPQGLFMVRVNYDQIM